jgi:hypothetical protein
MSDFTIRQGKAGEKVICSLCSQAVDFEGRGVLPCDGPVAVDGKGRPVCGSCLEERAPDFFRIYTHARLPASQVEHIRRQEARSRIRGKASLAEGEAKKARAGLEERRGAFAADIELAVAADPRHLTARRKVVALAAELAEARELAFSVLQDATRADERAGLARDAAEEEAARQLAHVAELLPALAAAEESLAQVDAKIREELAGGVELPAPRDNKTPAKPGAVVVARSPAPEPPPPPPTQWPVIKGGIRSEVANGR